MNNRTFWSYKGLGNEELQDADRLITRIVWVAVPLLAVIITYRDLFMHYRSDYPIQLFVHLAILACYTPLVRFSARQRLSVGALFLTIGGIAIHWRHYEQGYGLHYTIVAGMLLLMFSAGARTAISVLVAASISVLIIGYVAHDVAPGGNLLLMITPVAVTGALLFVARSIALGLSMKEKLDASNRELQQLSESQRRMFAIIAHELRTPTAAISMLSNAPSVQEADLDEIHHSAEHLLQVIDNLRQAVNPEQAVAIRDQAFALSDLIRSVSAQAEPLLGDGPPKLQIQVADNIARANYRSDPYRLRSILTNLVRNAYFHSKGSVISISVNATPLSDHREQLMFRVEDDGIGIAEDEVESLFPAFARGNTQAGGTGVGLYLVRSWSESLGGAVRYFASPLGGAGFEITLPLPRLEASADGPTTDFIGQARQLLEDRHILLVEDDRLLRKLQAQLIRNSFGADVHTAVNGRAGLELVHSLHPLLVITDYFMPEMSGRELLIQMRRSNQSIPVIGVTAATIGQESDELIAAGADVVLSKPLDVEELARAVLQLQTDGRLSSQ